VVEFEQFFRAQHPRLVAIALALVGDVETARDAAQEALLRAYRDWERVSQLDQPPAWVRKVVVNLAIDGRRRRRRDERVAGRLAAAVSPAAADLPESSRTWELVRELPDRQRAAVVLRYVDDLSVPEIAEVLGVTDGTVKASLHAARATLGARLAEVEP
jgi:RNA polymerase sigma-70 factor (ECF subfamily)